MASPFFLFRITEMFQDSIGAKNILLQLVLLTLCFGECCHVQSIFYTLPILLLLCIGIVAILSRIKSFLEDSTEVVQRREVSETDSAVVMLRGAEFTCYESNENGPEDQFSIRNLNITFPTSKLSVIAGLTGSGKPSLILGLLGGILLLKNRNETEIRRSCVSGWHKWNY
jgi:ABC-type siderophore export system fused ATPase/permease subunit